MAFVQLNNISLSFGERQLLNGVNLNIASGSRTALSGGNGSGKSTLMKIIAGLVSADGGEIIRDRESRTVYLPQSGISLSGRKLIEDAETAYDYILPVIKQKEMIEHRLSETDENTAGTESMIEELHILQEKITASGYYSRREQAAVILKGLGFSDSDLQRLTDEFSGGWQMRIALARVLLSEPDIMLLDEPTNYLDLEARNWLEGYLNSFAGGFIIVSHDRFFLDSTVNEVVELFNGRLKTYKGNYSFYEKKREQELQQLIKDYNRQQEEIAKTEEFINRFRYQATKAKQVQSRIKQLEKMERIELPESMKHIHFRFPDPPHSGRQVLKLENLFKAYGQLKVISGLDLQLEAGDKLVIAGRNGAGKSTLMRIIAGLDSDYTGSVVYGSGVAPGYFSQDVDSVVNPGNTVLGEMEEYAPTSLIPDLRSMLGAFLFRGDDIYKPTSVLSGGEKNRLALLKILLHPSNLLILDEPTNHLDLQSKDVLLEALQKYSGTLVFVSHDRYFIEKLATRVLELEDGKARQFPGDYAYYLWKKQQEEGGSPEQAAQPGMDAVQPAAEDRNEGRQSHQDAKKIKNRLRSLEREEEDLLEQLDGLDADIARLNNELQKPEIYSSAAEAGKVQEKIAGKEAEHEKLLARWEELEQEKKSLIQADEI